MDTGNISPLTNEMEIDFISSPDSIMETPIQHSPSQSDIIKDSVTLLVNKGEEDEIKEKWLGKNDFNDEEFQKKLITWLKVNNLAVTPNIDNLTSLPSSSNAKTFKEKKDDNVIGFIEDK